MKKKTGRNSGKVHLKSKHTIAESAETGKPKSPPSHSMEKIQWKPGTMIYPLPAVLVSCGEFGGDANIITIAWTGIVCTDPAMCYISVRPERHSYGLIRKKKAYCINLTTRRLAYATDFCGVKSGRDIDKFKELGLTPVKASKIDVPIIAESPVNIECRVVEIKELGVHHMFLSEIVAINASRRYLNPESGAFNLARAEPICYSHGKYYETGKYIGKFGFSVRKKGKKRVQGKD